MTLDNAPTGLYVFADIESDAVHCERSKAMSELSLEDLTEEMGNTAGFISTLFGGWNHGGPIKE